MLGQELRRALADEANAQPVDHRSSGNFFEFSISSRMFCADLSPMRSSAEQIRFRQLVDVRDVLDQPRSVS